MSDKHDEMRKYHQAIANELGRVHGVELAMVISMKGGHLYTGNWAPNVTTIVAFLETYLERLKASRGAEIRVLSEEPDEGPTS